MKTGKSEKYIGIGLMVVGLIGVVLVAKFVMDNNKRIKDTQNKAGA